MKPIIARTLRGSYVSIHLHHWFAVVPSDITPGAFEVACASPGADDLSYLYTWSAYPEDSGHKNPLGEPMTMNEYAAESMLRGIMSNLALGLTPDGILEMQDCAKHIAENLCLDRQGLLMQTEAAWKAGRVASEEIGEESVQ